MAWSTQIALSSVLTSALIASCPYGSSSSKQISYRKDVALAHFRSSTRIAQHTDRRLWFMRADYQELMGKHDLGIADAMSKIIPLDVPEPVNRL